MLHVGEDIGDYRIVAIIGAGSMGQVFQAEHGITKRKEALKVLVTDVATEGQAQRFKREIEVQARLDHPNIARVHNALHLNDSLILVTEFVEGESLEKKIRKGKLSKTEGLGYICQALSALQYAHEQGVVHRDVTPGNLIIDQTGNVKLTDFGLAKSLGDYQLTNAGEIVGSLHYMPPEQVRRHGEPDPRSDIYSTAAVLYEILTGKKLFDHNDRLSLMLAQVEQQPVPPLAIDPTIGSELNAIVLNALAKDPNQRYQSAKEFRDALQPFATGSIPSIRRETGRRHLFRVPLRAVALTAFTLAFTGGTGNSSLPKSKVSTLSVESVAPAVEIPADTPPRSKSAVAVHAKHQKHALEQREMQADNVAPLEETSSVSVAAPATPEAVEPEIQGEPAAQDQPAPAPHKKGFWSRWNPFKRKKPSPTE